MNTAPSKRRAVVTRLRASAAVVTYLITGGCLAFVMISHFTHAHDDSQILVPAMLFAFVLGMLLARDIYKGAAAWKHDLNTPQYEH